MLVDPAMLAMLKDLRLPGQPDPVEEILTVFEADGQRMLARLQLAARNQDARGAHEAAHRMKGSAANLGAVALQGRLQAIETVTKESGLPADLDEEVARLTALFRETVDHLKRLAQAP
jgi:HPt (histidine-containing phosphotransfer) domain-containing protein